MKKPALKNSRTSDLKRLIQEALHAWEEEQDNFRSKFPAVPPAGPPWPFVGQGKITERVLREQGTLEQSQEKLLERLKRFKYPYPEGNIRGRTFYDHLKDLGLLSVISSPELITVIRQAWILARYHELELELRAKRQSQYGYPMEFHRKMMNEIAGHLGRLDEISSKYGVPQSWFAGQRPEILKRLFREASIVYPELRRWLKTAHGIRPHSLKVWAQLEVLDAIRADFRKIKIRKNKLAYQLTALFCSLDSTVAMQKLDPTPEKVRRNAKDRMKSRKKTSR
jgi:hypothetical protein